MKEVNLLQIILSFWGYNHPSILNLFALIPWLHRYIIYNTFIYIIHVVIVCWLTSAWLSLITVPLSQSLPAPIHLVPVASETTFGGPKSSVTCTTPDKSVHSLPDIGLPLPGSWSNFSRHKPATRSAKSSYCYIKKKKKRIYHTNIMLSIIHLKICGTDIK